MHFNREYSFTMLLLSLFSGKNVTGSFVKRNLSSAVLHKRKIYRMVENLWIMGSVLNKYRVRKCVFLG
jgi:hypothetical protein